MKREPRKGNIQTAAGLAETKREHSPGATPLTPDEMAGLLLPHITARSELDRWEQDNIAEAESAVFARKRKDILSEAFIRRLHKLMFGNVWRWAGRYRQSDKNIGVEWWRVQEELRKLCDDASAWIGHKSFPADEIAARFHHRLVFIHPFANGNGRHARMMADLLLVNLLDRPKFSWGSKSLAQGECRGRYIAALRQADKGNCFPLFEFVRS